MVRTGLGGSIPGRRTGDDETDDGGTVDAGTVNIAEEISDDGGGSSSSSPDDSSSSSDGSSSLRDRVRDSLGGDPVDSGGGGSTTTDPASETNSRQSSSGPIADDGSAPDPGRGDVRNQGRSPQRGPSGPPNSRQSGGGSLTDQGLGVADALNEQVTDEQSTGGRGRNPQRGPSGPPNSRQSGGGSITDQGLGQADALNEQMADPSASEQRSQFRQEAAEELGTDPSNVEITRDGDTFRASADLSNDQQFVDELAGGRFAGVVERAEDARDSASDALSSAGSTYSTAAGIPAALVGGTVARGFDAAGVDPNVSGVFGDAASAASSARSRARSTLFETGETAADVLSEGAPSEPVFGPGGAQGVNQGDAGSFDRVSESAALAEEEIVDAFDAAGDFVPDVGPREGADTVQDVTGDVFDTLSDGAPSEPLYGPDGPQNVAQPARADTSGDSDSNEQSGGFGAEEALALGAAGVVTPEPSTSVGGAVLAGGAALALGVGAARRSEVDTPDPSEIFGTGTSGELEPGEDTSRTLTREIEGDGEVTELEPNSLIGEPEFATPSGSEQGEIGVPQATPLQQQRGQLVEEEDPRQINPEDIRDPFGDVEQDPPSTRERQRRDDLDVFERDFPTGESSVVGRNTGQDTVDAVEEAQQPTLDERTQSTGVGGGSSSRVFPGAGTGVGPRSDVFGDVGAGADAAQAQRTGSQLTNGFGTGSPVAQSTQTTPTSTQAQPPQNSFGFNPSDVTRRRDRPSFDFGGSAGDPAGFDEDEEVDVFGTGFADPEDFFANSGESDDRDSGVFSGSSPF